jgi:hypothetical protein
VSGGDPEPVRLGDLEVADRIARAVRRGRTADRRPTVEQLVAAFGETEATPDARRRAARALALAGVAAVPDLLEATPGERVTLEVRRPRRRRALLLGLLALAALFAAAAALASQVGHGDNSSSDLPAGTTTTAPPPPPTTTTQPETPTTAAEPQPTARARRARARRARERRARERRARERRARARAAARRRVTVRVTATAATFLCVDGDSRRLFDGTLSGSRTFRARVVRMNVGLGPTTRVTANGKAVPLTASPTGVQITRRSRAFLPRGARPCA